MTTTTSYGTWVNHTNAPTVEQYCYDAFGSEGPAGFDLDTIVADYRAAINDALPATVTLNGDEFYGPYHAADQHFDGYPTTDDGSLDIHAIVESVDFWAIAARHDHNA
jgi:hypothetical protein